MDLIAKTYEYTNGQCFVDGVLQTYSDPCTDSLKWLAGFAGIIVLILIINLVFFIFWIIALIHAIKHEDIKNRPIWITGLISSIFVGLLWAMTMVYYFAVMRPYKKGGARATYPSPSNQNIPKPIA